jgi:alkanesulfonate monooxygenase SsuD/methylene tetrahydromethanopterin reductase-like flavin-dependent oxidoreductase (luciferase family)
VADEGEPFVGEVSVDERPVGLLVMEEDLGASLEIVRAAEAAGLHSVWTIEFYNRDSFVRLAAFATQTRRITLGSSITVAFTRAPLVLATAAADVQELAGGRLVLGLEARPRTGADERGWPLSSWPTA